MQQVIAAPVVVTGAGPSAAAGGGNGKPGPGGFSIATKLGGEGEEADAAKGEAGDDMVPAVYPAVSGKAGFEPAMERDSFDPGESADTQSVGCVADMYCLLAVVWTLYCLVVDTWPMHVAGEAVGDGVNTAGLSCSWRIFAPGGPVDTGPVRCAWSPGGGC